ncbi:MAG: HAD family hydrolase [Erysipelotrichaceae bacterium]|nr:HAD family hydrolase [Erysipelotrichaceae bacterium]
MKNIKLFASDIDGTFTYFNNYTSKKNIEAVKKLEEAGIHFLLCSGRGSKGLHWFMNDAGLKANCIGSNGNLIMNKEGEIIFKNIIPTDVVKKVMKMAEEMELIVAYHGIKDVHVTLNFEDIKKRHHDYCLRSGEDLLKDEPSWIKEVANIEKTDEDVLNDEICECEFIYVTDEQIEYFNECFKDERLKLTSSGHNNFEILPIEGGKDVTLLKYCESLNIDRSEVVFVGDNKNDLDALLAFENSWVVGNASDEIKKLVKNVAPRNDEDGVAYIIEEILKNR